jgi:osmotically inducible protein OsmC
MNTPDDIIRSASVHWDGDIAHGKGTIATGSGVVSASYSFGTRFSNEPGTNPEELLAAAHAACFSMALSGALTRAGHAPASIDTEARVYLHKTTGGFEIPRIALTTKVSAPGLEQGEFEQLAAAAKEGCPVSKALRAVDISLEAILNS